MGAWRKVRKVHVEEKGWKIDTKALEPFAREKVFTIPSPARRTNPELRWALETVPLVAPVRKPLNAVPKPDDLQA
jgi:hypothetical protein